MSPPRGAHHARPRPHAHARGRPRSAEVDTAILDAAVEELISRGWDGFTVEGVAERAEVGKAAIYRRYASKVDLVIAAAEWMSHEKGEVPRHGELREDVREMARAMHRMLTRTRIGRAIPVMVAARQRSPELRTAYRRFIRSRRDHGLDVLRGAVARGELPADTDVDACLDAILGPIYYRVYVSGERVDDAYLDAHTDRVVAAFTTGLRTPR